MPRTPLSDSPNAGRFREHLRPLIRKRPSAIYLLQVLDDRLVPVWVSKDISRITGYAADEVLASVDWWTKHLHPADRLPLWGSSRASSRESASRINTAFGIRTAITCGSATRRSCCGIHHSDRGNQYASHAFQAKLKDYGMACSMSRKGNCWDNAPTESWFGSFKNERVYGERFETRDEVIAMTFEYMEVFYNRKRLHSTLSYKSPMQFLSDWLNAPSPEKLVA